ncbi:flavodoxin FldB [Halioxenophilus sp. WMMB6]|uniref:flavodoxin FldB n=1 Tax=Halioxenophilus sp. WMMB6 TaxID=3073815 RepID=UPI00295F10C5|nr:flavodoxin FldB [Halioxenophilus sp. WMMB6]
MTKIGLFFGSDEGNTESVAEKIQSCLGSDVVDIHDIADVTQLEFDQYDKIILGISTWDFGQIQSDWEEFWPDLEALDFSGKTIALFGLGDQFGYGDFFLDALGMLHDVCLDSGAHIIGHWSAEGYEFDASKAYLEDEHCFVGLGIDEDQQEDLSTGRINRWCQQIHQEFGLSTPLATIAE